MPRRFFIVNPEAVRSTRFDQIQAFFADRGESFESAVTTSWEEGSDQTRRALKRDYDQIVAVGGDGTVNSVVNGFFEADARIKTDASLAVIPMGTASDYFKTLGAGEKWQTLFREHQPRRIDIGRIRYLSGAPSRYFMNMASLGASALIVRDQVRSEWLPKKLRYLVPTLRHTFGSNTHSIRLKIGEEEFNLDLFTLFALKGLYAGGGMRLGGAVSLDDGFLDVTLVPDLPLAQRLAVLPKIYTGGLAKDSRVQKFRVTQIELRSSRPISMECDGELAGTTDAVIEVVPRAISVLGL